MTVLNYDLTDTGQHICKCPGEVIKSWLESESITSTRTMDCRNPTLGAWRQDWKVDMELAGPVSTEPLEPRRVTEPAGALAAMWCGRPVFSISIQDACRFCSCPAGWCSAFSIEDACGVLFVSSRLVFSIQDACGVLFVSMFFRSKDDDKMVFRQNLRKSMIIIPLTLKRLHGDKQILSAGDKTVLLWDHTTMTECEISKFWCL